LITQSGIKKNFVLGFSEKVLRAILTFVSLGIVARYLGPEQYGYLSYILTILTYFQLLGAFGLDHALIRIFNENYEDRVKVFWKVTIFKFIIATFSIVLYFLFLFLAGKLSLIACLFSAAIIYAILDNTRILLETENKHFLVARTEIIYQSLSASLKILIAFYHGNIELIYLIFILDFLVPRLLLLMPLRKSLAAKVEINFSFSDFKYFFNSGKFYCLNAVFVILYMKIDQVMIGNMLGMEQLGNYAAAARISDAWYFLPVTVSSVFYPLSLSKDKFQEEKYLQIIFDLITIISVCVIIPSLIWSDEIFDFIFGERFNIDKRILSLLFVSGFFISLNVATAAWLNVRNDSKTLFSRALVGTVVNVLGNLYLLPRYGLIGGAVATFFAYGATIIVTFTSKNSFECFRYFLRSLNFQHSGKRIFLILLKRS
jgi:O-antigen/teichoic acid export membrane protein